MGTRHLTMVQHKGKIKVAQYGQWDGYPSSAGVIIANFIHTKLDLPKFKKLIAKVAPADREAIKNMWVQAGAEPGSDMVTLEVSNKFKELYPQFSRDTGADILDLIQTKGVLEVEIATNFAADSLFCEWAYVVNLDDETVEVYKGFNEKPLKETDRFYYLTPPAISKKNDYYPVRLIKIFKFHECTPGAMAALEKELSGDE